MKTRQKANLLILGHVITMDEHKPRAEAVAVKDGKILYVGDAEVARHLCDEQTKICDFGSNYIYPGFLEAHCHPGGAGYKMTGAASLGSEDSLEKIVQDMKAYMEKYPEKELVVGMGMSATAIVEAKASMLDAICPDKSMACLAQDGHSAWLNTPAMKRFGIDKEAVKKWGTSCVRVDAEGNPTGSLSEGPAIQIYSQVEKTVEDMKTSLLAWQEYALSNGYTAVYNAGVQLFSANEPLAYYELEKEGKLKHYTFAGSLIKDNTPTPEEDIAKIVEEAQKHNSKHFKILGAKAFCDGVMEARTAWLLDEYKGQPGYHGVVRFSEHDKMVRLLKAASDAGLNVHIHTIGDAAIKAWVDAIAEAEEATGNFDMRNALAHLQVIRPEDIKRMADYNIVACDGIMWISKEPGNYDQEVLSIGEERALHSYPIKSYLDHGAVLVSHSDCPVSPTFSAPHTICFACNGTLPSRGKETIRNTGQLISRKEAMKTVTTNVAYSWHAEHLMGSLEMGKLANLTVFDKDFLQDSFEELESTKCLATFVDGEMVYQA